MNWGDLSDKQRANFLALGAVALLLLAFIFSMIFLDNANIALNKQLKQERTLSQSLLKLQDLPTFPKLSTTKAKRIVSQMYRKMKGKRLQAQGEKIIFRASKVSFSNLLVGLQQLKNKHNIVVTSADIKRVDAGAVAVEMTLIHP